MMTVLSNVLQYLSAATLGLWAGALLLEGGVLVPLWRSLPPEEFFTWHPASGPRLYRFFYPVTVAATLTTAGSAGASLIATAPGRWFVLLSGVLCIAIIVMYFLYFERTNAKFAKAAIKPNELSAELARWASWHWVRVGFCLAAFASALLALSPVS
jgi:hypothetical protein